MNRTIIYAIGGNALLSPTGQNEEESSLIIAKVMSDVIDLLEAGWRVILTHGNGPQVGHLMSLDGTQPMDAWVAATQGMIGHNLAINLDSILRKRNRPESTAVVLTRVEVDVNDEGFKFPSKPVGPVLNADQVMTVDWDIAETIKGPRRVVASPKPIRILDIEVIRSLIERNAIVICCGGGGIPVVYKDNFFYGVPSVIDKDLLSSLLAIEMSVDALIVSTAVDSVKTNFGTDKEKSHDYMTLDDARKNIDNGEFPAGSMGPKVEAICLALESIEGLKAIICQPGQAISALRGDTGTTFVN